MAGGPHRPMLAKVREEIPEGPGWRYEPKWDGFRAIVRREGEALEIRSRDDRPFNRYYPEIETLVLERGGPDYVLDGEIAVVRPEGFGFDELLQRIHPAASRVKMLADKWPATLIVFDLLELEGEDLRSRPLKERRSMLEELAHGLAVSLAPNDLAELPVGPDFFLTPHTDDVAVARRW